MSLAELRDLFIVIIAILGIGATIFLSIIAFLIFRRIRAILDSGRETVEIIRSITSAVSKDIVKPLASIASVLQGIAKVLEFISGPVRRKRGERSGWEE
ncbi:MAG: hypothetical protein IBX36_02320 [Dehalococcoidia bacterium]|nr:hypothetical protein [Dehalococcoidia bacterium]